MNAHAVPDAMLDLSAERLGERNDKQENQIAEYMGRLEPVDCRYVNSDEVLVTLKTAAGTKIALTLSSAMLVHLINLSVGLINNFSAQVFRDLELL